MAVRVRLGDRPEVRARTPGLVGGFEVDWNRVEMSFTELGEVRSVALVSSLWLSEVRARLPGGGGAGRRAAPPSRFVFGVFPQARLLWPPLLHQGLCRAPRDAPRGAPAFSRGVTRSSVCPTTLPAEATGVSPDAAVTAQGGHPAVTGPPAVTEPVLAVCTWSGEVKQASANLKEMVT